MNFKKRADSRVRVTTVRQLHEKKTILVDKICLRVSTQVQLAQAETRVAGGGRALVEEYEETNKQQVKTCDGPYKYTMGGDGQITRTWEDIE